MSRLPALGFMIAVVLSGQSRQDLRSRYGEPVVQRYRIDTQLRLATRYGPSGETCTIQVAPADFDQADQPREKDLDALAADLTIERLVPGYLGARDRSALDELNGWRITREYRDAEVRVTLSTSTHCSSETRSSLEQRYGPPEYERFRVEPGLMLSVTYDANRTVKRIDIGQYSTTLHDVPYTGEQSIDVKQADRLIDDLLSPAVRLSLHPSFVRVNGIMASETRENGRVSVSRYSGGSTTLGYSIVWP